jgi:hypothetical protein
MHDCQSGSDRLENGGEIVKISMKLAVFVGALTFIALWSIVFCQMRGDWRNHRRLARSGVELVGTVTAKEPRNHQSVRYDYLVAFTRYPGKLCAITAPSEFDRIQIGDPIRITYLPEEPTISVCGDAKAAYSATSGILFIIVPFWALLGAVGIAFSLYRRLSKGTVLTRSNAGSHAN